MRKNALAGWLLLAPSLVLLGGLVVFPIVYNAWLSLFDKHAFLPVQRFVGLGHYIYFAHDEEFWNSFGHGLVYAGTTLVLQIAVGIPTALLLNEAFRGRNLLRGVVLFPYVIPTIVAVILWKWLLNDSYGLVNHLLVALGLTRTPVACAQAQDASGSRTFPGRAPFDRSTSYRDAHRPRRAAVRRLAGRSRSRAGDVRSGDSRACADVRGGTAGDV